MLKKTMPSNLTINAALIQTGNWAGILHNYPSLSEIETPFGNILHCAAVYGQTGIMDILTSQEIRALNVPNSSGQTPLGLAICYQKIEMAQKLLLLRTNVSDSEIYSNYVPPVLNSNTVIEVVKAIEAEKKGSTLTTGLVRLLACVVRTSSSLTTPLDLLPSLSYKVSSLAIQSRIISLLTSYRKLLNDALKNEMILSEKETMVTALKAHIAELPKAQATDPLHASSSNEDLKTTQEEGLENSPSEVAIELQNKLEQFLAEILDFTTAKNRLSQELEAIRKELISQSSLPLTEDRLSEELTQIIIALNKQVLPQTTTSNALTAVLLRATTRSTQTSRSLDESIVSSEINSIGDLLSRFLSKSPGFENTKQILLNVEQAIKGVTEAKGDATKMQLLTEQLSFITTEAGFSKDIVELTKQILTAIDAQFAQEVLRANTLTLDNPRVLIPLLIETLVKLGFSKETILSWNGENLKKYLSDLVLKYRSNLPIDLEIGIQLSNKPTQDILNYLQLLMLLEMASQRAPTAPSIFMAYSSYRGKVIEDYWQGKVVIPLPLRGYQGSLGQFRIDPNTDWLKRSTEEVAFMRGTKSETPIRGIPGSEWRDLHGTATTGPLALLKYSPSTSTSPKWTEENWHYALQYRLYSLIGALFKDYKNNVLEAITVSDLCLVSSDILSKIQSITRHNMILEVIEKFRKTDGLDTGPLSVRVAAKTNKELYIMRLDGNDKALVEFYLSKTSPSFQGQEAILYELAALLFSDEADSALINSCSKLDTSLDSNSLQIAKVLLQRCLLLFPVQYRSLLSIFKAAIQLHEQENDEAIKTIHSLALSTEQQNPLVSLYYLIAVCRIKKPIQPGSNFELLKSLKDYISVAQYHSLLVALKNQWTQSIQMGHPHTEIMSSEKHTLELHKEKPADFLTIFQSGAGGFGAFHSIIFGSAFARQLSPLYPVVGVPVYWISHEENHLGEKKSSISLINNGNSISLSTFIEFYGLPEVNSESLSNALQLATLMPCIYDQIHVWRVYYAPDATYRLIFLPQISRIEDFRPSDPLRNLVKQTSDLSPSNYQPLSYSTATEMIKRIIRSAVVGINEEFVTDLQRLMIPYKREPLDIDKIPKITKSTTPNRNSFNQVDTAWYGVSSDAIWIDFSKIKPGEVQHIIAYVVGLSPNKFVFLNVPPSYIPALSFNTERGTIFYLNTANPNDAEKRIITGNQHSNVEIFGLDNTKLAFQPTQHAPVVHFIKDCYTAPANSSPVTRKVTLPSSTGVAAPSSPLDNSEPRISSESTPPTFTFIDVPGDGNCFFHALADQLKKIAPELLKEKPSTTDAHTYIRGKSQGPEFSDRAWADEVEFNAFVKAFPVILAIIDRRSPEGGFNSVRYFDTQTQKVIFLTHPNELEELGNLPIVRLAADGTHFVSVSSHSIFENGVLVEEFALPEPERIRAASSTSANDVLEEVSSPTSVPLTTDVVLQNETVSGRVQVSGTPMTLSDLKANLKRFGIDLITELPTPNNASRYLIIDSDTQSEASESNIDVVCLDIQGETPSCGDNALWLARQGQSAGFKTAVYVRNNHAVALIEYNPHHHLNYNQVLAIVTSTELIEEESLREKFLRVTSGTTLYLGHSTEAVLQAFYRLMQNNATGATSSQIESLLTKITSINNPELNGISILLQDLLKQVKASEDISGSKSFEEMYNTVWDSIIDFVDTAANTDMLQLLLWFAEENFVPQNSNTALPFFPPYYPQDPDDDNGYYGGQRGADSADKDPGSLIASNTTNSTEILYM